MTLVVVMLWHHHRAGPLRVDRRMRRHVVERRERERISSFGVAEECRRIVRRQPKLQAAHRAGYPGLKRARPDSSYRADIRAASSVSRRVMPPES